MTSPVDSKGGAVAEPPPTGVMWPIETAVQTVVWDGQAQAAVRATGGAVRWAGFASQPEPSTEVNLYSHIRGRLDRWSAGRAFEDEKQPSAAALSLGERLFEAFVDLTVVPERVIADGEGGLAFYFFGPNHPAHGEHVRYCALIADADGDLLVVLGDREKDRSVVNEISGDEPALRRAVSEVVRYARGRSDAASR